MTTQTKTGLTPLAKGLLTGTLLVSAVFATRHFAPGLFGGSTSHATPSTVPPKANLPKTEAPATTAGCTNLPEIRMLIWAWNAQQGLLYANGGTQATDGSLMCKHGVNLALARQDDATQMQAELIKCATELSRNDDCKSGAHYVAIMGDGSAQFIAALNPQLAKISARCAAATSCSATCARRCATSYATTSRTRARSLAC
jgi:hypothetical protein